MTEPVPSASFLNPAILLVGDVDQQFYTSFRDQLMGAPADGVVVVEVTTSGGDPEIARAIGEDLRFHSEHDLGRRFVFLGKAQVYSAGVTLMSFFSRDNRYLTRGTRLMIHERQIHRQLCVEGPLTGALAIVRAQLNELEESIAIQNEGFENLIRGSSVELADLVERARSNWYVRDDDAVALGLVEAVI